MKNGFAPVSAERNGRHHHAAVAASSERPRVLVVEDDSRMRRFVVEALEDDFSVTVAPDGWSGLERVSEARLDLVVAGSTLTRLGNDHFVQRIRAHRDLTRVPILVRSTDTEHALRVRLLHEGALDYVVEPFSVQELRARALNLANAKRLRDLLEPYAPGPSADLLTAAQALVRARDHARRAEWNAQLENRAKDQTVAMVAHALRAPLDAILRWTSMLDGDDASPNGREAAHVIRDNARTAIRLVQDLLDPSAPMDASNGTSPENGVLAAVISGASDGRSPAD